MIQRNGSGLISVLAVVLGLTMLTGCVPLETRPTLAEARLGRGPNRLTGDLGLRTDEMRAEVLEVIPPRSEIRLRMDDGRDHVMTYSLTRTSVNYHGWDYTVENLESGDLIAFRTAPRNSNYIDAIRVQEPVQARAGPLPPIASPRPRSNVIEGTAERIQYDMGVFDVRTRTGERVTVSIPYNARTPDVDNFRRLRNGDYVRLEGEFVNRDNLQLYSFLSPR